MPRTFKLLALMILLGAVSAKAQDNSGSIKDALPPGINLNDAKLVEIRDEAGSVVLTGTFSNCQREHFDIGNGLLCRESFLQFRVE
jgi:hypothetical protein